MKPTRHLSLSVCLVSLSLGGPVGAQGIGGDAGAGLPGGLDLPPGQLKRLEDWIRICDEGGDLAGGRSCDDLARLVENPDLLGSLGLFGPEQQDPDATAAAPAPEPKQQDPDATAAAPAPEPEQQDPDATAAAPAPEPEQQDPDATAAAPDPEPEQQDPDATAAAPAPEPEQQDPDATAAAPAPAPEQQDPDATAAAPAPEPEQQDPDATAAAPAPEPEQQDPDATAAAPDPEPEQKDPDATAAAPAPEPEQQDPDATAAAPAPEPEQQDPDATATADPAPQPAPQQPDPQAQADAVERMERNAPAAALGLDRDGGERIQEFVDPETVRRSDQDFSTDLSERTRPRARDDEDDNDQLRKFAGAALVGLGAVALAEILDKNDKVVTNSGDRVVVERNGQFRVLRNDDALLRRPGAEVETTRFEDGSTRSIVTYEDGTVVETIRAADGRVVRRVRILPDGEEVVLFDDTQSRAEVDVSDLPEVRQSDRLDYRDADADALARALAAQEQGGIDRRFSLAQVRNIDAVRRLVPVISVDNITFETGSAAIRVEEAEELAALGNAMRDAIARNPGEVFLIEGHTDAVGGTALNLALSDRRAESVALALTEYFQVPPENMVLQGYGESDLLIPTDSAERANRRAAVRRITPLLQ